MMRPGTLCLLLVATAACNREPEEAARKAAEAAILGTQDVARAEIGQVITGPFISGELQAADSATI
jgi:hypothetical protein